MDIVEHLRFLCDQKAVFVPIEPGVPHCPACDAISEIECLRAQVAELLPFAIIRLQQTLDNWRDEYVPMEDIIDAANRLGRIKNGEFGKVQWPNG